MANNDIDRIVNNALFNARPIITDSIKSGVSEVMKSNVVKKKNSLSVVLWLFKLLLKFFAPLFEGFIKKLTETVKVKLVGRF